MAISYLHYPSQKPFSSNSYKHIIIFLHGLGANANDFCDLPQLLGLPSSVGYVFPQAPQIPVTINGGMVMPAWYDIESMDFNRKTNQATVRHSVELLYELLDELIANGISADRVIVGGFSQGGAMALEIGLHYPKTLGGVISLSAYSLNIEAVINGECNTRKTLPIFMAHGRQDQVVPFALANQHRQVFQEHGFHLDWWEENNLGHHLSGDEVNRMKFWLQSVLT